MLTFCIVPWLIDYIFPFFVSNYLYNFHHLLSHFIISGGTSSEFDIIDLKTGKSPNFAVGSPTFIEVLKDEDSRLLNSDFGGGGLQNGLVAGNIHGFKVYVSNKIQKLLRKNDQESWQELRVKK